MPGLKTIDGKFKELGYTSDYTPSKDIHLLDDEEDKTLFAQTKQSLGQTVDIILPKSAQSAKSTACRQLIDILGSRYLESDLTTSNNNSSNVNNSISSHYDNTNNSSNNAKSTIEHKYKHNDQLRQDVIDEFLLTEESYLRKLQALVETIVKPLKHSCSHDKHPILNRFMCTNIFLNLEQILELHQLFMKELKACKGDFATICLTNVGKMDRYRRYLLKVNDAHELHSSEYQKNQAYRSFVIKTITNPVFKKLSLKDLLDQPWKRITAYTLLLKDIRNHTSSDHPDFEPLSDAFNQINTIASVRDDVPTILATKSHDLYLSIRKAPCHLIKQSRSLITHLDAVEINRITGKTSRHVTIFLFCDKIMVASRSSSAKGADICDGVMASGNSPLTNNLMHKKKKGHDFKFCGWVGLEHIDLFHGPSDLPGAIILRASSDFQDSITEMGYEKYFQKGARIFAYQTEPTRQTLPRFMEEKDAFVDTFYKTQALSRQYGNQDATYHRSWNDTNVYSNVYDYETYTKTEIKNNVAAILLEKESEVDIPTLLASNRSSPWIVALVRPDNHGLKLNIWTRVPLSCLHDQQQRPSSASEPGSTEDKKPLNFATVFWNNVIKCEKKLRCSSTYRLMNESLEEQEMQRPPRSRSRSSMSRSTSVSNISRFFSRSRSQSPSASLASSQVVPTSSRSTPSQHQQEQHKNDDSLRQRRPRSHSMSNDPTPSSDSKAAKTPMRRRKLSFDASSLFKIDIKSLGTANTVSSLSSSVSSATSTATIQQQPSKLFQPKRHTPPPQQHQPSIRHSSYSPNRRQSLSSVATTPIPVPSSSYSHSPPPMMHPTELPPPSMYFSSQQPHRQNGHASNSPSPPMTTDSGKQRQLIEKLDAMYQDMTGIGRTSGKEQQSSRHTSDPVLARPPSRSSSASPTSPVSMTLPPFTVPYHHQQGSGGNFGTSSSRSSSYTNTFSSHASQSSRSSFSLEEMDSFKGYGPSPRLANADMVNSSNNLHHPHDDDDEITRKVMTDLANGHKKWSTQKSLLSHYTSAIDFKKPHHQNRPTSPPTPTFNGTPTATMSMPALAPMEKEPALDHVATVVDHCSYQVGSKWQFLVDKQRMLGNQVNRVSDRLPLKDADADMLNEMYRDTMDETSNFFNKINTELKEISTIVNAYRQGYQQHQQRRNSSIDTMATGAQEADALLKRKLKEAQLERDYWHRRASELTTQVNDFVLKQ